MTTETNKRRITIDQNKRFSQSALWRMQREYFDKEGINAWANQVPFYITSNPFIANTYAEIVLALIKDYVAKNPDAVNHPFYIMELGTGSGRFSFFFVKTILALLKKSGLQDIKICYIMSDFTKHNVEFWENHHAIEDYIKQGIIDFAIYDMEAERPITLIRHNIKLTSEILKNPLILFANYIFDTISHDSFAVHEGKLYELLLTLTTDETNMQDNRPVSMEEIKVDYSVHEIKSNYYHDTHLDPILLEYKKELKESSFLFPIGSLKAIKFLRKLANDKLLIISTDKGYSSLSSLDNLGHPSISFHGSFSMMVNFHAIASYFKNVGGDALLQTPRKGIKTSLFCSGFTLDEMPLTKMAAEKWVEGFSPSDYFTLHRRISDSFQECTLDTIAAHLNLSDWDPHIYLKLASRVIALVPEADRDTLQFLATNMPKMAANYYHMPKTECILFEIAVFYHAVKQYPEAIEYYLKALPFVGEQFGLYYNLALCYHYLEKNEEALKYFKKAISLDSNSKETEEWIQYLEKPPQEKTE